MAGFISAITILVPFGVDPTVSLKYGCVDQGEKAAMEPCSFSGCIHYF